MIEIDVSPPLHSKGEGIGVEDTMTMACFFKKFII